MTDLFDTSYRANTVEYPGLLEELSERLGVSMEALNAYDVGYASRIEFKNGPNFDGWWTVPARDPYGKVVGYPLRARDGKKIMVPGSKHGLIYPLREGYTPGQKPYLPGPDNWVRTMEEGLDCPICGKPDGCLLSRENPEDPQAVICIREEVGSLRPMSFGHLFIRKAEGHLQMGGPLPWSERPVLVVEGLSDALTAYDMGFIAVGRTSAKTMTGLTQLLKGRDVIVMGENDGGAGVDGMHNAYALLTKVAASVKRVLPPSSVKDLRIWRQEQGVDAETLINYAETHHIKTEALDILPSGDPLPVARQWLRATYWDQARQIPLLRKYGGAWYNYNGHKYEEVRDTDALRGEVYQWLDGRRYEAGEDKIEVYVPTRTRITDVLDALNADCPLTVDPPSWIDGTAVDPADVVVFNNGVLDVERYLSGEGDSLSPLTPTLFTLTHLPYDFDPEAECPLWHRYLDSTFKDDAKVALLQEWFGYCMIADMRMEKMMLFYGPSGSGKGTALDVLTALVGRHHTGATKLRSIGEQFGLEPLVGKLVAIMSDVRLPRSADSMQALETLLQVVGGDAVDVPRKHRPNLAHVKLTTRFTLAANELPELPDHSQALLRRMNILHFETSFIGKEDKSLKAELPDEAPGIALWALEGLRRLRETGSFTSPSSSAPLVDTFRRATSPVIEFLDECTVIDEGETVPAQTMFSLWAGWCAARGMRPGNVTRLMQRVEAGIPEIEYHSNGIMAERYFENVRIDDTAAKRYV